MQDGNRRVLEAVDQAATTLGLRPGLAVAQAMAVVPGLIVAESDPAADSASLERLARWCHRMTPLAATDGADGLWLDVAGCTHLWGGEANMLAQIEARLAQFSHEVGEVIGVAQWVGNGVTFVNWFESSPEFSIRLKPGLQLGITTSATAKLLAAYLPRDVTEPLVKRELAERRIEESEGIERVYGDYAEIRGRGIANSLGANRSGLNALSVPVFDREGQVVVAVTALGMAPRFDADVSGALAQQMLALSGALSAQMGGPRSDATAGPAVPLRRKAEG